MRVYNSRTERASVKDFALQSHQHPQFHSLLPVLLQQLIIQKSVNYKFLMVLIVLTAINDSIEIIRLFIRENFSQFNCTFDCFFRKTHHQISVVFEMWKDEKFVIIFKLFSKVFFQEKSFLIQLSGTCICVSLNSIELFKQLSCSCLSISLPSFLG